MNTKNQKFVLYTNPDSSDNLAYTAIGIHFVKEVLSLERRWPAFCRVLHEGVGSDLDIRNAQSTFSQFKFK